MKRQVALCLVLMWTGYLFAQTPYKEIDVKDGGSIRGGVYLTGDLRKTEKLEITKDNDFCGVMKESPRLVVGKNKGVKNAIVYIEEINQGKKFSAPAKFVLEQRKCEYQPHVLVLPQGTELEILNSDPILHNVHAYNLNQASRSLCNIAQPIKGQRTIVNKTLLPKSGIISATCDAGHPWMCGYIMVASNPYYAITDDKGEFRLENVPPGSYKLRMWHEGVTVIRKDVESGKVKKYYFEEPYEIVREITVPPKEKKEVTFELAYR